MLRIERIIGKNIKFICTNNGRTGICSDGRSKYASFNLDADCCIALSNARIYKVSEVFAMAESILGVVQSSHGTYIHPYDKTSEILLEYIDTIRKVDDSYMNYADLTNQWSYSDYIAFQYGDLLTIRFSIFEPLGLGQSVIVDGIVLPLYKAIYEVLAEPELLITDKTQIFIFDNLDCYEILLDKNFKKFVTKLRMLK